MINKVVRELFPELAKDKHLLSAIEEAASIRKLHRGDVIIDYGDYIKSVPLVISGLLKIIREAEDGHEVLLYFLGSGQSCAASFSCCMVRKRSEIKAVCEDDATILLIPLEAADEWMGRYSVWRNFVLNMYDRRMYALIDTIDRVSFSKLDEKLIYYLQELTRYKGETVISISHQQIAYDLNASRESISRLLKKLETSEVVKLGRNSIELLEM